MAIKNTEKLYYQPKVTHQTFLKQLTITEADREMLLAAREKVRQAIRQAFKTPSLSASPEMMRIIQHIQPKFVTQGSFVYGTLNTPCQTGQQIDLDDGVYLPMSLFNQYGKDKEILHLFFRIIDSTLRKLCDRQPGWTYEDFHEKCGRINLSDRAHLDTPLYAIPDISYTALNKQATLEHASAMDFSDTNKAIYNKLDPENINLGTRNGGWIQSDPLILREWFNKECIKISGGQLQRVCRYLKAWRDSKWLEGGPSSIALMICAVNAYPTSHSNRDDVVLLHIAKRLPGLLKHDILNPAIDEHEIVYSKERSDKDGAVDEALGLKQFLTEAIEGPTDKEGAIRMKRSAFGNRIPNEPGWISVIGEQTKSQMIAAAPLLGKRDNNIPAEVKSA